MSGKSPRLNPLESRKQLLIAESELNRAQLIADLTALTAEVRTFARRAKSLGSIAASATALFSGLAAFRRSKSAPVAGRPSWWETLLAGVPLAQLLWAKFRPQPKP